MTELGGAFWCARQLADAETQFRLVAERSQAALGPDSEAAIQAAHNLGGVLRETGRLDEAEAAQRSALERAQRILGPEHPRTLAILSDLSTVVAMRDAAQALPLVRDLIPRIRAALGEDDPLYVVALANLAADLEATGDRDGAISVARDALERSRRILGDDAPNTTNLAQILVVSYSRQKRYDEAETLARTYIEALQRTQGSEAAQVLDWKEILGGIFMGQQRYAEAVRIRTDVLAVRRRVFGESSPAVAPLMYNLACSLALDGKRAPAIDLLRQSVAHGYNDADWMSKDTDLASLHGDRRFEAVVAEASENAQPAAPGE
jgi:tetratricopeptide (TPR) repeat protein